MLQGCHPLPPNLARRSHENEKKTKRGGRGVNRLNMTEPIFIRTRQVYDSYSDLWRLVELAGFPTGYPDEVDAYQVGACYILPTLNGEWAAGWPNATARLIHYDLEWRLNGAYPQVPGVSETWTADAWYARRVGARYVPLGSDVRLALSTESVAKIYHVTPLAYVYGRRQTIIHRLQQSGLRIGPNGWGQERDLTLRQSWAMLHIHQHAEARTIAPLRWCIAAAYGLPMIAEAVEDGGLLARYDCALWSDFEHLAEFTKLWTSDEHNRQRLMDIGRALQQVLCVEHGFRKGIEQAL